MTRPPEPIERTATVSSGCRWTLGRRWGLGPTLIAVGNNPSDADARRDDPTMWRLMSFAFGWGYGGVVMLNIYPFITPKIETLRLWRAHADASGRIAANITTVAAMLHHAERPLACWGNLPDRRDVAMFLRGVETEGGKVDWYCLGTTRSGAPTHPMARGKHRVPDNVQPVQWSAAV